MGSNDLSMMLSDLGESFGDLGTAVAPLAGLGVGLYVLAFGMSFLVYLLTAIAMMRMAGRTRTSGGWMAFFPIFDMYLLGKIADAGAERKHHAKRIMSSFVLSIVFSLICGIAAGLTPMATASGDETVAMIVGIVAIAAAVALLITLFCHAIYKLVADYRICVNFGSAGWFFGIFFGHLLTPLFPAILRQVLASKRPKATN